MDALQKAQAKIDDERSRGIDNRANAVEIAVEAVIAAVEEASEIEIDRRSATADEIEGLALRLFDVKVRADEHWQLCSADSVEFGMLIDLDNDGKREGEPREVTSKHQAGTTVHMEFNDDDPGASFAFDELVWVRDKASE